MYDPCPEGYCVPDQNCYQGFTFTSKTECDNNYGHLFVIDGSQTSYFPTGGWIRELIRLLIRNIGDINGLVIQEQQELITSIIIMQILILQVWIVLRQHLSVASGWSKMKDIF